MTDAWRTAHEFVGRADRDCETCGLPDRAECHRGVSRPERTAKDHVEAVKVDATRLAETLKAASDAGVSHALILPQLVFVFREVFGEMPAGFTLPGMPA